MTHEIAVSTSRVRLRLLGPVEIVSVDGRVSALARRQERALLAILVIQVGLVIPVNHLCEMLWEGEPPVHARRMVQSHVARIRAALARAEVPTDEVALLSHRDGYSIRVAPDAVDAHRFRALAGRAATVDDPAERDRLLTAALGLWRGQALQNSVGDRLRERLCAELDELWLGAVEDRMAIALALGRERALLPDLAGLTAEHPTNERLAELYMTALYRSGRTVDALKVYSRVRTRLADEFGVDAGAGLQRLHVAILRGDREPAGTGGRGLAVAV